MWKNSRWINTVKHSRIKLEIINSSVIGVFLSHHLKSKDNSKAIYSMSYIFVFSNTSDISCSTMTSSAVPYVMLIIHWSYRPCVPTSVWCIIVLVQLSTQQVKLCYHNAFSKFLFVYVQSNLNRDHPTVKQLVCVSSLQSKGNIDLWLQL